MESPQLQLPTYESLVQSGTPPRASIDYFRLRWYLSGPISDRIEVLSSPFHFESERSPYQTGPDSFHPISRLPVSRPPVSSIRVTIINLSWPLSDWEEEHKSCGPEKKEMLPVPGSGGGDTELPVVVRCCGSDRPDQPSITVRAPVTSGEQRPFVSIHDYITTVHPWLLSLESDIRAKMPPPHPRAFDVYVRPLPMLDKLFIWNTKSASWLMMGERWKSAARYAAKLAAEEAEKEALRLDK
ncbi:hypothetical protein C7999DRAFT_32219 [Corynascus novoguineensis]|uniref:Uncharacterized protein n=1 Tax=Corynascus novoguineensis TaxID=1126955 RepID=A0AAN7CS65_9PEZI|nr:hypothetical protein C7999DRAFT_32219 [Corynascus novoguineensis]